MYLMLWWRISEKRTDVCQLLVFYRCNHLSGCFPQDDCRCRCFLKFSLCYHSNNNLIPLLQDSTQIAQLTFCFCRAGVCCGIGPLPAIMSTKCPPSPNKVVWWSVNNNDTDYDSSGSNEYIYCIFFFTFTWTWSHAQLNILCDVKCMSASLKLVCTAAWVDNH